MQNGAVSIRKADINFTCKMSDLARLAPELRRHAAKDVVVGFVHDSEERGSMHVLQDTVVLRVVSVSIRWSAWLW